MRACLYDVFPTYHLLGLKTAFEMSAHSVQGKSCKLNAMLAPYSLLHRGGGRASRLPRPVIDRA